MHDIVPEEVVAKETITPQHVSLDTLLSVKTLCIFIDDYIIV